MASIVRRFGRMRWLESACGLGLGELFYHCETKSIIYVVFHTSVACVNCASKAI